MDKIELWLSLSQEVQQLIQRHITEDEFVTLGFILNERYATLPSTHHLAHSLFDLEPTDTPIVVCYQIHQALAASLKREYQRVYEGSFGEETEWWKQLRESRYASLLNMISLTQEFVERALLLNESTLPLVGVPHFALPRWITQNLYLYKQLITPDPEEDTEHQIAFR